MLYVGSPLFINELAAGHVLYLVAAAALPHALAGIIRVNQDLNWRTFAATMLWVAFAVIQIQFLEIVVLCALVAAAVYRSGKPLVGLLILLGFVEAPFIVATLVARTPAFLGADVVLLHWLSAQSLSASDAVSGFGYFAGYAQRTLGIAANPVAFARIVLAFLGVIAVVGGFVSRRAGMVLLIPALVNVLVVTGDAGPLGPEMQWAFVNVPALAVFRELYHLVAMPTLFIAVVVPAALARIRPRAIALGLAPIVALAALPLAWIVTGAVLHDVPSLASEDAAAWQRAVETIARDRSSGAVLLVPNLQPLGPSGEAGADPEAFMIGRHPVLYQFQPDPVVAWTFGLWLAGDSQTLSRLGVAYVARRNDWVGQRFAELEPALKSLASDCENAPRPQTRDPLTLLRIPSASPELFRVRRPPARYVGLPPADAVSDDPRLGWVHGERWSGCFSTLAELPTPTLFTLGTRLLRLQIPPSLDRLMVWAPRGARISNGAPSSVRADSFVTVRTNKATRVLDIWPLGPTAVTGFYSPDEAARWWEAKNLDPNGPWRITPTRASPYVSGTNQPPGSFPAYVRADIAPAEETLALRLVRMTIVLAWILLAAATCFVAISYASRTPRS